MLVSLVGVAAIAALSALLSYDGGRERWGRFAISVILIYMMALPLGEAVRELGEADFSELYGTLTPPAEGSMYEKEAEEAFCFGIAKLIEDEYDIPREDIGVSVTGFSLAEMRAEYIKISLTSRGAGADFREIENFIKRAGLGECEVEYVIF